MTPRSDRGQRCESCRIDIEPPPSSRSLRPDYFGNSVTCFSIETGYRSLDIIAVSDVRILSRPPSDLLPDSPPWEQILTSLDEDLSVPGIDARQFRYDSPGASASDELADYSWQSFTPGRPIAEAARELTSRIHADFTYEPGTTTVQTSVAEAFALKRGVCQDFAHVAIASLRSIGLAARYVSGYVRTIPPPGQPRLIGADASHAWFGVYCGPAGWIDFDPTNDAVPATDHVTIAWGRDYSDVTPVRGLFIGGGRHEMTVSVDVAPMDEENAIA